MSTVNKVFLLGRLTRDPELKHLPGGKSVADFSIAVDKISGGEKKPVFVDMKAWEKTAEVICQYLGKGDPAHFEGRLDTEEWDDKQTGAKRRKTIVQVERVTLLGRSASGGEAGQAQPQSRPSQMMDDNNEDSTDDDLPF